MKGEEKKRKIIEAGAGLIHEKGFYHTGLKDILDTAGIPKGSFYHFFKSKEDFGLQVIRHFSGFFSGIAAQHLAAPGEKELEKLENMFIFFEEHFSRHNFTGGCPIGNLSQETAPHLEGFAQTLEEVFVKMRSSVLDFLKAAAKNGEIPDSHASEEMADMIINSWEGTLVRMKTQRSITPLTTWRKYICRRLLPG